MQRKLQAEKQRKGRGRGKPAKASPFLEPLVMHGGQRLEELARFGFGRGARTMAHPPGFGPSKAKQTNIWAQWASYGPSGSWASSHPPW